MAERPGRGAAAGGGSGFELVPGGVGLLPHEHYNSIKGSIFYGQSNSRSPILWKKGGSMYCFHHRQGN